MYDLTYKKERTPIETLYIALALLVGIIFVLSMVGQNIKITTHVPANAVVYADLKLNIYYAPPYIDNNRYPSTLDIKGLKAETVSAAQALNHSPDRICVEQGYFQEQDTLNHTLLWKLGLAAPRPSRWNPDGSWNW